MEITPLGTDARSLRNVLSPENSKCVCWIKSDPTFEGLRQIFFEPESRVKIQPEKPEQKEKYSVINSVRFLDTRSKKEFPEEKILLNQNLNSIIGGKSSGKSLLLYHIAKTIDPERIESINKEKGNHHEIAYPYEKDPNFDFEVEWDDGKTYKLKDKDKPNRSITFIPQLYLNRLAEDQKAELNALVEKMLRDLIKITYPTSIRSNLIVPVTTKLITNNRDALHL